MTEPYCTMPSCPKQFIHYHCPEPGCTGAFEHVDEARWHGGEPWHDGRGHGGLTEHPSILTTLPEQCNYVMMVEFVRRYDALSKGEKKYLQVKCSHAKGHAPSQWRKDGHYNGSWPKSGKAFIPTGEGANAPLPLKEIPKGLVRTSLKKCPDCEETYDQDEPLETEPKYECSCGNEFMRSDSNNENHICPDCGKFASKITDDAHVDCGGNLDEAEEVSILICIECDEKFEEDDTFEEALEHVKEHGGG